MDEMDDSVLKPPFDPAVLVPAEALLFAPDGAPALRGSRCTACGEVYFPVAKGCSRCLASTMEDCNLGDRGTLWSWTVQGFLPKPPYNSGETAATFQPYGVGYVEMASGIKIHTRLTTADPARLRIGEPFTLVIAPYGTDPQGRPLLTFAFQPTDPKETGHA